MREKLLSIGFVLMLMCTCIPVVIGGPNTQKNTIDSGQPDLVFDKFELIKQGERVYLDWTIKNTGDASTGNESVRVNVSFCYFGVDILIRLGFAPYFIHMFSYPLFLEFLNFCGKYFHFFMCPLHYSTRGTGPLDPGESETCWWPVTYSIYDFENYPWIINDNICIIIRGIIDEYDAIAESNESNNQEVIRIWFPFRNDYWD